MSEEVLGFVEEVVLVLLPVLRIRFRPLPLSVGSVHNECGWTNSKVMEKDSVRTMCVWYYSSKSIHVSRKAEFPQSTYVLRKIVLKDLVNTRTAFVRKFFFFSPFVPTFLLLLPLRLPSGYS